MGGPATASSRRDQPSSTASGLRHMGIAGARRRAGAPRGTAGDLGSMAIVPHQARRGPSAVTGTAVTVSGQGGLCPRGRMRSPELDRDLWILCWGPSARERSSGLSLSSSPLTECGENGDRERLRFSLPPLQLSDLGR